MSTSIEWTDDTWNPVVGCSPVSDGCQNCYAARMAKRQIAMGNKSYVGTVDDRGRWTGHINFVESALEKPLGWRKPRRIFVNSMSDIFHENVPDGWIAQIFQIIRKCPRHTFQLLTKRPKRALRYFCEEPAFWPPVHFYVSISNQYDWDNYGHYILQFRGMTGISYEPALEPIDWDAILSPGRIGHVICGGESGPGARPMHPEWARAARDACVKYEVPFFFKQWGEWRMFASDGFEVRSPKVQVKNGWQARRVGKRRAGRILDGRTWDEMPEGVPI